MKDQAIWKAFYEAAIEFRNLKPWEWMYDSDIFAVQDPDSGETNYCCIMGNAGEHFAFGLYLGQKGLESYLLLSQQPTDLPYPDQIAMAHNQHMLKVEFANRDDLSKKDLEQVKALGLKFRGKNKWILPRFFTPGSTGWLIDSQQAQILTYALQQACDVAKRFKKDNDLIYQYDDKTLLRTSTTQDDVLQWNDQYIDNESFNVTPFPAIKPTPALIDKALSELKQAQTALLFLHQYAPMQVMDDDGRIVFPRLALWLSNPDGMVVGQEIMMPNDGPETIERSFFQLIHQLGFIPAQIGFNSLMGYMAMTPLMEPLGIEPIIMPEEPVFDEILSFMGQYMGMGE